MRGSAKDKGSMKTMQARFDEHSAESAMTREAAERVFQLLARWAVRRARESVDSAVQAEAPDRFREYSVCMLWEDSTSC